MVMFACAFVASNVFMVTLTRKQFNLIPSFLGFALIVLQTLQSSRSISDAKGNLHIEWVCSANGWLGA